MAVAMLADIYTCTDVWHRKWLNQVSQSVCTKWRPDSFTIIMATWFWWWLWWWSWLLIKRMPIFLIINNVSILPPSLSAPWKASWRGWYRCCSARAQEFHPSSQSKYHELRIYPRHNLGIFWKFYFEYVFIF